MTSYKIGLSLAFCLFAFWLKAQVPAPQSFILNLKAPNGHQVSSGVDPIGEDGLPKQLAGTYEVLALIALAKDQSLQAVHLQIIDEADQAAVLTQSFDLMSKVQSVDGYRIQRDGEIIQIHLGSLSLPAYYRCEVKVEDVNGVLSPATIYNSSL